MTRRPRRPAAAAARVLVLGVAVAALMTAVAPGAMVGAQGTDRGATDPRLTVTGQSGFLAADGTFQLTLDVAGAPPGARLEASLHAAVADRSEFLKTLYGVDLGRTLANVRPVAVDDAASVDGHRRVVLTIALKQPSSGQPGTLSLSRGLTGASASSTGVYPLEVQLMGPDTTDDAGPPNDPRATLITHVVRLPNPDVAVTPLRVGLVLPLHAPPAVTATGHRRAISADDLQGVADLARMLGAHPDVPVSLAATPETVESLESQKGRAAQLLALVRQSLAFGQIVDSPYVDLPLSSWVAANLTEELGCQRDHGRAVLEKLLGRPDGRTVMVPGPLTAPAAQLLRGTGVDQVVLTNASLAAAPPTVREAGTESPFVVQTPLASPLIGIVSSETSLLTQTGGPVLGAHRVLADLALVWQAHPSENRGVVIAPPPSADVDPALLEALLAELALSPPTLRATTLATLFAELPTDRAAVDRARDPAPTAPDLDGYPDALRQTTSDLSSFATLLPAATSAPPAACTGRADPLLVDLTHRLDVSGAVDLAPATQLRFLDSVDKAIARRIGEVDAPLTRQTITLTARDGKLPLVLRNRLRGPINVLVQLDAGTRIEFPDGDRIAVRLEPGTQRIPVRVRTRSPGSSPLRVRVTSPDGGLQLASTRYSVRSTAVSGIGAGLTVGALLFLVVWWGRHWRATRRSRAAAATPSEPPPAWSGSAP